MLATDAETKAYNVEETFQEPQKEHLTSEVIPTFQATGEMHPCELYT